MDFKDIEFTITENKEINEVRKHAVIFFDNGSGVSIVPNKQTVTLPSGDVVTYGSYGASDNLYEIYNKTILLPIGWINPKTAEGEKTIFIYAPTK